MRSKLIIGLLVLFPACDDVPPSDCTLECGTYWRGGIPYYEGPTLHVRACLRESACSDDIPVALDWDGVMDQSGPTSVPNAVGANREYDDFTVSVGVHRPGGNNQSVAMELLVSLTYEPRFAASLREGDRAELMVRGSDGEEMMNVVSQVPYRVLPAPDPDDPCARTGDACRTVDLDLDGSERVPTQ